MKTQQTAGSMRCPAVTGWCARRLSPLSLSAPLRSARPTSLPPPGLPGSSRRRSPYVSAHVASRVPSYVPSAVLARRRCRPARHRLQRRRQEGRLGRRRAAAGAKAFTLVTPDPVAQNEFLKLAVSGVKSAAKAQGAGAPKVFQSSDTSSQQQNVQPPWTPRPTSSRWSASSSPTSRPSRPRQHPEQQFLLVDACTKKTYKNVTCAVFREHEAVYLAGAEAGLLTKSKKVGAVDVLDTPQFRRYSEPFAAGAKKVEAGVSLPHALRRRAVALQRRGPRQGPGGDARFRRASTR